MATITRYSTLDLPVGQRFHAWWKRLCEFFGQVSVSGSPSPQYVAWEKTWWDSDWSLSHLRVDPRRIELDPDRVVAGPAMIHVVFPLVGSFHAEQRARTLTLEPGEWGLYDPSEGFQSDIRNPIELLCFSVPKDTLVGNGVSLDRCAARRFSSKNGTAQVAYNYLTTVLNENLAIDPYARTDLTNTAIQLVRLSAVEQMRRFSDLNPQDLLRARIWAYVNQRLRDPGLSVEQIATAHRCSPRYLHKLFADGETLFQYIRRVRLQNCFRDLSSPELAERTVTEVALSWGFQHSGAFSRAFREAFDQPPSSCRPQGQPPERRRRRPSPAPN